MPDGMIVLNVDGTKIGIPEELAARDFEVVLKPVTILGGVSFDFRLDGAVLPLDQWWRHGIVVL